MNRRPPRGFTLIELLVVLLIVGMLALAVGLSVSGRNVDDRLESESQRIERLLQLAADEALAGGQDLGLRLTEEGFDFVSPDPSAGGWSVLRSGPFTPRVVREPFGLELIVDGEAVEPVAPAPETAEEENDQRLDNEASKKVADAIRPAVLILGSGEMTPFVLDLYVPRHPVRYRIEGNLLGQLTHTRIEDDT